MIKSLVGNEQGRRRSDKELLTEDQRRALTLGLAWFGWVSTGILVILRTTGALPMQWGSVSLVTIGIGIAASLSRGRMRLADTIGWTFESGLKVATILQANITTTVCTIETDLDGEVIHVDHPEAIGWTSDDLLGRNLNVIIPDRFLRQHQDGFKRFQQTHESRVAGATLTVPVLSSKGDEMPVRLSVARLSDTFLGTLVPLEQKVYEVRTYEDLWQSSNGGNGHADSQQEETV